MIIGELVNCNTQAIGQQRKPPAGRSWRVSSFFKNTGLTEDRFDSAFRGRLGFPKFTPPRVSPVARRTPSTRDATVTQLPNGELQSAKKLRRGHEKVCVTVESREIEDRASADLQHLHPKVKAFYKTTNAEYGKKSHVEEKARAGLSSYVGSICKEITLEKVFH